MSEDDYELFEEMFSRYARTYQVPKDQNLVPLLYVGETYFIGKEAIQQAIESGMAQKIMDEETLLDPLELIYADVTFNDLIILSGSTLLLGLLDAFNPCALAMLLMFLSFLTDKKRSKTILYICFSYILAVFVTYFILGRFLATALSALLPYMKVFYSIIILLALFISILNFLDFMSARKQKYGEIKNQLPNKFFVLTRKIMSNFSEKIESGNKMIYVTAFLIGAFVAIVEFPCSGQAFVAWTAIVVDRTTHFLLFNILLFIYVLFFVAPLIIITFIGLRAKSINTVSNFIRTRLDIIKLMNSIIFLGVAIYYIYKVFIGGI
ncbi:MAG: hypothetical protein EOL97_16590 [Spirochaetia bacterium]|nr:hypothetical protein [Spirochaetia bacterium]